MDLMPILFLPVLKQIVWGTERFKGLCGGADISGPVGECWLWVDSPSDQSVVANGSFAGRSLREFLAAAGCDYGFSQGQCAGRFNMINKYIDSTAALSVQVHPDELMAGAVSGARPKDECWYIIESGPDSFVYAGLKDGVTRQELATAIEDNTAVELLRKFPAKPGDLFFIPAGMVHSLGANILAAEFGTSSTTIFRLYDWGRVDADGIGRELNIETGLTATCFDQQKLANRIQTGGELTANLLKVGQQMGENARILVDCQFFSVVEVASGPGRRDFTPDVPLMIYQVHGHSRIYSHHMPQSALKMSLGSSVLYPAGVPGSIEYANDSLVLIVTPGDTN